MTVLYIILKSPATWDPTTARVVFKAETILKTHSIFLTAGYGHFQRLFLISSATTLLRNSFFSTNSPRLPSWGCLDLYRVLQKFFFPEAHRCPFRFLLNNLGFNKTFWCFPRYRIAFTETLCCGKVQLNKSRYREQSSVRETTVNHTSEGGHLVRVRSEIQARRNRLVEIFIRWATIIIWGYSNPYEE